MARESKVLEWPELVRRATAWRQAGRKIVHCHGVFDLLHVGHIRYLQRARQLGDVLVVTVTPDRFVNKGPHRPAFHEQLRVESIAALDCVDAAAINRWPTATEGIAELRPTIYAKGGEFREKKTPELLAEEAAASQAGTRVEFIEELTSSSSELINRYLSPFAPAVEAYVSGLRARFSISDILSTLERCRDLRILIVGESIIDEYYSCSAIGQSTKAPIVTTRYESHERFASGAVAVANQVAAFCGQVDLVTIVGETDDEEQWIRTQLRGNVQMNATRKAQSPTIVKRRYRESYFELPLFAINFLDDRPLDAAQSGWLIGQLEDRLDQYDAVLVADYGHGMLVPAAIERLCAGKPFLAVSCQADASNVGLHTISKYRRADFFSLAQRELELECRSHGDDHEAMLRATAEQQASRLAAVTFGQRGCLVWAADSEPHAAPSLATRVVDRTGAGDAFFAISSLCAAQQAEPEIVAFLGNLAGAECVAVVGNAGPAAGESLLRSASSLWK
jgi:rfaE bifunctional protein nucleotidyltransferase chain/domain